MLPSFFRTLSLAAATLAIATAPVAAQVAGSANLGVSVQEYKLVAVGYRASKIIGAPVYNDQKQQVGKVADFVVTPDAFVSYVIVSVGGFLGMGAKDVAVPAKRFQGFENKLILPGATKQSLEQLPAFKFAR
jgi:sporulation protein YlmC with PRC-barrel domain